LDDRKFSRFSTCSKRKEADVSSVVGNKYPDVFTSHPKIGTFRNVFLTIVLCFSNRETRRIGSRKEI
jgi:hypothetical protein